jgi:DNA repair photolyase
VLDGRSIKGRGATENRSGRFESLERETLDDGWGCLEEAPERLKTSLGVDRSRTVMSFNQSPDLPFDRSINPYRGCEHGCIYCYARPSHAWLGLSPGLDFETRILYKADAADCLRRELARPGYACAPVMLGANTDAYQPAERKLRITRAIVEVLDSCDHPVRIVTKSSLVERDMDLLASMAERGLCAVAVSITSFDAGIVRKMEPRAVSPARRLKTVERLTEAGIPVEVPVAPVIPVLTDGELERILERARNAGEFSAQGGARLESDQGLARRQGLRVRVRHPHARTRRLRRSAGKAVSARVPPARVPGQRRAGCHTLSSTRGKRRSARALLRGYGHARRYSHRHLRLALQALEGSFLPRGASHTGLARILRTAF